MQTIHERIRAALADQNLQTALDGNAERRTRGRLSAMAAVPDWQTRRQRAHAVRAAVIADLDELLARFIARVRANGIQVHLASDAVQAVQIVLEIARSAPRRDSAAPLLFSKAKSMLSDEIGLNQALEAAGHKVYETDLGEFIIQLRGERPSHLLTPAVHLVRQQVGQLFHEKLGIPYTDDIPTLVAAARRTLREVFLKADIGLSGVNFGVVESGTLCLVTNEGNGRMCTTLPPVHIALMGMERLLPTLDDLALLLSLLPRSATGQKLSVYTQLIHFPENGQQKHLVIIDNGRSALRASPLKESLYCIRCGSCLNACPVFREIGGHAYRGADDTIAPYPGPIGSVISPGLAGPVYQQLAQASTLCGACREACPVDIDLPKLLLRVRGGQLPVSQAAPGAGLPAPLKLILSAYSRLACHPRLFALAQRLASWFSAPLPAYLPLPALTGWGHSKDLPKPAAHPFRARYAPVAPTCTPPLIPVTPAPPVDQPAPAPQPVDLPALFIQELTAAGGQAHLVSPAGLPGKLLAFLRARGLQRVQLEAQLPFELARILADNGIQTTPDSDPALPAGITGALAGSAASGTLLLAGGPGHSLTASLLPDLHIALLRAEDILPSLDDVLRLPALTASPSTVLVTGPSRTADIEMALTIGAHGPKEVHVFLIDSSARQ